MSQTPHIPIVIVAALSRKNRAIGYKNKLLWHIPDDLKRFKELTLGHPIIMGRKTFESILQILGKPLPGRRTIVVTRNPSFAYPSVEVANSLPAAISIAASSNPTEIHIGGGAEIYREALPYTDRLHLTLVDGDTYGDAFFPPFTEEFVPIKEYPPRESGNLSYQWVDYQRAVPSPMNPS